MNETAVVIQNLSKAYGTKQALHSIDLTIPQGMFGLLGRNGAGKTTLMRTLATLLQVQSGQITVCGVPIERAREIRRMIGYLPQDFSMYGGMTVREALDYLGVLSGMDGGARRRRIPLVLQRVNLEDQQGKRVRALSGGMKQRLGIAQALLHQPRVLIVDEPTAGLDPEERVRLRNLLCEVAEDRIVLLSTHIVGDVEATCERLAILDAGRLLFTGEAAALLRSAEGRVYRRTVSRNELPRLKQAYTVASVLPQGEQVQARMLSDRPIEGAELCAPSLEDAYMLCLHAGGREGGGGCASVR